MRLALTALAGLLALGGGATETIDRKMAETWKDAGVRPAPLAGDYEFFRRLSIDLRGVIPTAEEVREFAASTDASKREKLIDRWLQSDAFVRTWAERWTFDLLGAGYFDGEARNAGRHLKRWIGQVLKANMPYDRFARRLLTAKGPLHLDPAAGYLMMLLFEEGGSAKDAAVRTARVFLGTQIRCAECHDHPFDSWQQDDFKRLTAFFTRTRTRIDVSMGEDRLTGWLVDFSREEGDEEREATRGVEPRLKDSKNLPKEGEPRRKALARILVAEEQFARAAVNRHWGMLLGRGLIHPLDGFTSFKRPKPGQLLDLLAKDFAANGYDVRKLMKSILMSRPYQLSSKGTSDTPSQDRFFARGLTAPMRPRQLFDSLSRATGWDRRFGEREELNEIRRDFSREFSPSFENDEAQNADGAEPTISQALLLLNGWFAGEGIQANEESRLGRLLEEISDPGARIEELFLSTLSRPAGKDERDRFVKYAAEREHERGAYEDLFWALINSTEFVTRH